MKITRAKNVKASKVTPKEKTPYFPAKATSKPSKGKPRILGTGTFQKKEHSPRVV